MSVTVGTYVCSNVLGIALEHTALYGLTVLLAFYNLAVLLSLNRCSKANGQGVCPAIKKIINIQICADLLILTVLLHFSGGIENPFVFFFIFHMIIASILLSARNSYLHATFAVLLFGLMILLEYSRLIDHHCLKGFVSHCSHQDTYYVFGTFFVLAITLFLVVYMASYVAVGLRRAEQALRQANSLLREKDRTKDEYVFRVTHDIKGHVGAIQSCLGVVVNKTVDSVEGRAEEFVGRAHSRTKKLGRFVRALLTLTEMRLSGKLDMSDFSGVSTVENGVASVKSRAEDKSITLICNLEASVDTICGDQFSIEEVITNLLLNAIKYTPEQGSITLSAKGRDRTVLIEVADTGIGIPADETEHVFEEFFRATNAKASEKDGTGLGLSIVKQIVERHGGKISVQSQEGQGTTFTAVLPKNNPTSG